jgi:hypothetical protein
VVNSPPRAAPLGGAAPRNSFGSTLGGDTHLFSQVL